MELLRLLYLATHDPALWWWSEKNEFQPIDIPNTTLNQVPDHSGDSFTVYKAEKNKEFRTLYAINQGIFGYVRISSPDVSVVDERHANVLIDDALQADTIFLAASARDAIRHLYSLLSVFQTCLRAGLVPVNMKEFYDNFIEFDWVPVRGNQERVQDIVQHLTRFAHALEKNGLTDHPLVGCVNALRKQNPCRRDSKIWQIYQRCVELAILEDKYMALAQGQLTPLRHPSNISTIKASDVKTQQVCEFHLTDAAVAYNFVRSMKTGWHSCLVESDSNEKVVFLDPLPLKGGLVDADRWIDLLIALDAASASVRTVTGIGKQIQIGIRQTDGLRVFQMPQTFQAPTFAKLEKVWNSILDEKGVFADWELLFLTFVGIGQMCEAENKSPSLCPHTTYVFWKMYRSILATKDPRYFLNALHPIWDVYKELFLRWKNYSTDLIFDQFCPEVTAIPSDAKQIPQTFDKENFFGFQFLLASGFSLKKYFPIVAYNPISQTVGFDTNFGPPGSACTLSELCTKSDRTTAANILLLLLKHSSRARIGFRPDKTLIRSEKNRVTRGGVTTFVNVNRILVTEWYLLTGAQLEAVAKHNDEMRLDWIPEIRTLLKRLLPLFKEGDKLRVHLQGICTDPDFEKDWTFFSSSRIKWIPGEL